VYLVSTIHVCAYRVHSALDVKNAKLHIVHTPCICAHTRYSQIGSEQDFSLYTTLCRKAWWMQNQLNFVKFVIKYQGNSASYSCSHITDGMDEWYIFIHLYKPWEYSVRSRVLRIRKFTWGLVHACMHLACLISMIGYLYECPVQYCKITRSRICWLINLYSPPLLYTSTHG